MPIGLTDDQQVLAKSLTDWAAAAGLTEVVKASEEAGPGLFEPVWADLADLGVATIAVPESLGGAGGTLVDLAVAIEACGRGMVPGPLLPTALVATLLGEQPESAAAKRYLPGIVDGSVTVAVSLSAGLVWGAGTTTHVLLPGAGHQWALHEASTGHVEVATPLDLSGRVGTASFPDATGDADAVLEVDPQHVRDLAAVLAAAESAGISHWCLSTAVDYAKVREQFGRVIGSFQAVKHLCAELLEMAESATAVAWDAASAYDDDPRQLSMAAAVAGAVAPDLAVATAQGCIQVLGGIGFTWEHDAHLYLRRAMVTRQVLGGTDAWRLRLADLALAGERRTPHVDLGGHDQEARAGVRAVLAGALALPAAEGRAALADAGLVMPHWPAPYGRGAGPVEQLVIDEEFAASGVARPSIGIGAWACPTILVHGDDSQRDRFLLPTLTGEISWCQLFSEPGAGSDLASLRTRADRADGGWLLTGQKVWTSAAATADWGICLARTNPDAPQHRGITYFVVDMRSEGLDIRPLRELTGEALFNEVFLDGVFVPDDCVVGEVDGGWPLARNTLANERVALSDSSFGVSVERALATVTRRGEPGEAVRLRLGAAVGAAGTAKALGLRSTLRSLVGVGPGPESSVQKLVGVRERQDSAELALALLADEALLGGAEATAAIQEALVTRCLSIAGGTTQVLRNVAAERILGLPRG